MMKKLAALLLAAAMLLGVSPIAPAFALEAPGVTVTRDGAAVELVELGPDETVTLTASCPADWYIVDGAALQNASAELELTWAALGFVQAGSSVQVAAAALDGEGNVWTSAPVTVTAVAPAQEPQLPQDPAEPQLPDAPVDIPAEEPPAAPEPVKFGKELYNQLFNLRLQGDEYLVEALRALSEAQVVSLVEECDHSVFTEWGKLFPEYPGDDRIDIPITENNYPFEGYVGPIFADKGTQSVLRTRRFQAYSAVPAVDDEGLITTKTASIDGDTVTIDINAHTESHIVTSARACDIILVLDTSGSMGDEAYRYEYTKYDGTPDKNGTYFILRNGVYSKVNYRARNFINLIGHTGWWVDDFWLLAYWGGTEVSNVHDGTGEKQTDGTSGYQFYTRTRVGSATKLEALQKSATRFIQTVQEKSPASRVAVVTFASGANNLTNGLQDVTTYGPYQDANANNITDVFDTLVANGATRADLGMEIARDIFATDTPPAGERQKVVIMFTDGNPTAQSNFNETVANAAIHASAEMKGTYGARVYTVGMFNGDDVDNKIDSYMNGVSSNYGPDTTSMPGEDSTPDASGYYFRTDDSAQLEVIFNAIAQETGETIQNATVKDVIAPQFELTEEALAAIAASGGTVSTDENGLTVVNWPHTFTPSSSSSQPGWFSIRFTVKVKDGFLGGNGVYTNGDTSGVYVDDTVIETLPRPQVNVPITLPTIENLPDVNTYLSEVPTEDTLKGTLGDRVQNPFGVLEPWQTQYVNISTAVTVDPDYDAMADGKYTLTATVEPIYSSGTASVQTVTQEGNILVYTPEITISDMEIPLGDTPVFDETGATNPVRTVEWKREGTLAVAGNMTGTVPTLTYNFTPAPNENNYKADTYVTATVFIGTTDVTGNCNFLHTTPCTHAGCSFVPSQGQFIVHVIPFSLTIKKEGWDDIDENQSFVFTVTRQEGDFTPLEVVVHGNDSVTINGLPKGTYTVEEESGWSWRYTAANATETFTSADINNPSKTVTVTNTRQKIKWLSGAAYCDNTWINGSVTSSSAPADADNKPKKGVTD